MSSELQQVIHRLLSLDSASPTSVLEDIVSNVRLSVKVPDLFLALSSAEIDPLVYCRTVECLISSSSVEWFVPELAVLLDEKELDAISAELCLNETLIEIIERTYQPCLSGLINRLHEVAVVGTLSSEEDALSDRHIVAVKAASVMRSLTSLLVMLSSLQLACERHQVKQVGTIFKTLVKAASFKAIIVALEHQEELPWSSAESISQSKKLIGIVCQVNDCFSFESLLGGDKVGYVGYLHSVLDEIIPKLKIANWKQNPSMPYVFCYCLHSVGFLHLGEYLTMFLPPSLVFLDDHQTENRLLGLRCLSHIIGNCSRAELQWFGRAEVIYDSLQRIFYGCEGSLLESLIECLFSALSVLEKSPHEPVTVRVIGHHDRLFVRYLSRMESENLVETRRVYSRNLARFITKLGITTVRHLRRVIAVLVDYLSIQDSPNEESRFCCLDALLALFNQAWPRIPGHADVIMKALVRLIHDVSTDYSLSPRDVRDRLIQRSMDCVAILRQICPVYAELDDVFFATVSQCAKVS